MTKYGHYLAALDRDCPQSFRGKFISYKRLKKCLKQCQAAAAAATVGTGGGAQLGAGGAADVAPPGGVAPAAAALEASQARFFDLLKEELVQTNRCFERTAEAIVAGFQRAEMRRRLACCFPRLLGAGPRTYASLAERAYWCRKYARANAVALRKILKKYDKLCGGQRGRAFLQHCWLSAGGAFLHSPLLDELKAMQDMLQEERVQAEDMALCEVAEPAKGSVKAAGSGAAAAGEAPDDAGAAPLGGASMPAIRTTMAAAGEGASAAGPTLESPTCMLSSSDYEWHGEGGGGGGCEGDSAWCSPPMPGRPHLHRTSGGGSMLSAGDSCSSLGTSPLPGASGAASGAASFLARAQRQAASSAGSAGPSGPGQAGAEASASPASAAGAGAAAPALAKTNSSRFRDEDLRCPICLDVLYKPVGLACGHKFCKACCLSHAGMGHAIGTFANLASYVGRRTACPQCRQRGVYRSAMRLRQLDRVIRARCPTDWEERRQEERRHKSDVVEAAAAQAPATRRWMQTINARDALLGM